MSESDRFLTDMVGTVTDTYNYDAFGNEISSTGTTPNNYLFAGEQFDPALGFYYMRARYYRPATGRFWTTDTIEGKLCCGLSWDPYVYTLDNPVNSIDPTGREAFIEYLSQGPFLGGPIILPPILPIPSFPAQDPGPKTIEQEFLPTLDVIEKLETPVEVAEGVTEFYPPRVFLAWIDREDDEMQRELTGRPDWFRELFAFDEGVVMLYCHGQERPAGKGGAMLNGHKTIRVSRLICILAGALLLYEGWNIGGFRVQTIAYNLGLGVECLGAALATFGLLTLFRRRGDADNWQESGCETEDDRWKSPGAKN